MIRIALLIIVPVPPLMHFVAALPSIWVFVAGILSVAIMPDWIPSWRSAPACGCWIINDYETVSNLGWYGPVQNGRSGEWDEVARHGGVDRGRRQRLHA